MLGKTHLKECSLHNLMFETLQKITLIKNAKTPVNKWSDKANHHTSIPNMNKYNVGILTGAINNIFVLDIDNKDDGLKTWNEYLATSGMNINTVCVKTPSGGFHYYFKYSTKDKKNNYLIERYLLNKTKYRGVGIDIRSNGGYVVGPPSQINGVGYEFVQSFDEVAVMEMPQNLIYWLMATYEPTVAQPSKVASHQVVAKPAKKQTVPKPVDDETKEPIKTKYVYDVTDAQIVEMLSELPKTYLDNYSNWLLITTVMKNLDKYDIWKTWSKQSKNYNYKNNKALWLSNKGGIDINFIVHVLSEAGIKMKKISKHKPYQPLTKDIKCKKVEMNEPFVYDVNCENNQFKYKHFKRYDTCIIKSVTGTGKTTAVSKHMQQYMTKHLDKKLLSITARQSLSAQHVLSFKDIGMKSFLDKEVVLEDATAVTICINSLQKLKDIDISEYVVYIDEVASFLELSHNETLDSNLKSIYSLMVHFIKHAHKVIVSDALITDAVFQFLKNRDVDKMLYIENSFMKYEGVPATRLRNENVLNSMLLKKCDDKEPFLFGCDSCEVVTK